MTADCPFCLPRDVLAENELCYARYDQFPVSPGHALIIPRRHTASWFDLTCGEQTSVLELSGVVRDIIDAAFHPDGYNIGMNCGEAAGQTVMHVHVHLIPRYTGDVPNPRGGIRAVIARKQDYLTRNTQF